MARKPPSIPGLIVVKVGGSLYDHPALGPGLRAYLTSLDAPKVVVVAGGGPFAEAVRELDSRHGLGQEASHHVALGATSVAQRFLAALVCPGEYLLFTPLYEECLVSPDTGRLVFLECGSFLVFAKYDIDPVPETWDVTTDSIAALAARVTGARLILLKSTDIPPGTPWPEAAERGWVDRYFPTAVADARFPVEAVNFRKWLDEYALTAGGG